MKNAVVWSALEISTGPPFSTLKGLAFGPRPPALQYVDVLYLVRPQVLHTRPNPRVPLEMWAVAVGGNPGADFED